MSTRLRPCMALFMAVVISACGGGEGGGSTSTTSPNVVVALAPSTASVETGASLAFSATTSGSGNPAVTWEVNGVTGGNSMFGTVDSGAVYHAPAAVPDPPQVIVRATSVADPTKSMSAVVTIVAAVTVTVQPGSANVAAGGTLQLAATVNNAGNQAVSWQVANSAGGTSAAGDISAAGLFTAPLAAATVTATAVSVSDPTKSASTKITVLAPHRIGVRRTTADAEFFDRVSGSAFVPRGNNYTRLAYMTDTGGNTQFMHATFTIGMYDTLRTESALATMQASGYNVVTVPITGCCIGTIGDPAGGLSKAYLQNISDFLQRAKTHGIVVVLTSQWLPANGGYSQIMGPCYPMFDDLNLQTLSACGIQATRTYYRDLVQGLIDAGAPLDAIESYELWNEYSYVVTAAPLNATSGSITTANGQTYDLSIPGSRQQMMDDGLVYFADQVGAEIRALDPTALVTISFFPPQAPNPSRIGDPRFIEVYPAVTRSSLDYIDLHLYPDVFGMTLAQTVQNFGMSGHLQAQPVQMGELGAFKSAYPTAAGAAAALEDWQVQSCAFGFKGWSLWTWDTDEQPELWNAQSQGGIIDGALAPARRPDPCK